MKFEAYPIIINEFFSEFEDVAHVRPAVLQRVKKKNNILLLQLGASRRLSIKNKLLSKLMKKLSQMPHLASEYAEYSFVQIHDRMIAAFVPVNSWISVQTDYKIVPFSLRNLQEIQVTNVK